MFSIFAVLFQNLIRSTAGKFHCKIRKNTNSSRKYIYFLTTLSEFLLAQCVDTEDALVDVVVHIEAQHVDEVEDDVFGGDECPIVLKQRLALQ